VLEFLIRRAAISIVTLVVISLVVFTGVRMIPGDPARVMAGTDADAAGIEEIREKYGLNDPVPVQYLRWAGLALQGDLGRSIRTRDPVLRTIAQKLPITVELAGLSVLLALAIAIPAGVLAAVRRNTAWDVLASGASLCGVSIPNFWLGIMLILLFGVTLRWLPTSGFLGWPHLVLPAVTLAAFPTALVARLTRSSLLEILGHEYIRTGRAKGLAEWAVVLRHALKNATIPVITVLGLQIGTLLGGAVITESVFAWPGMGKLVVDAIFFRDFPVVQTVLILSATIFVVINLVVDLLYTVFDPRIRYA
jgi:peptide/nickel transport system permease protein